MTKYSFHRAMLVMAVLGALCAGTMPPASAQTAPPVPPPPGAPGPAPVPVPAPAAASAAPAPGQAAPAAASAAPQLSGFTPTASWSGGVTQLQSADRMTVDHAGAMVDIRLYGVDAPEAGQKQADEAKKLVMTAVTGQQVKVDVLTQDNLGVSVAMVTLSDGRNLSHALLEAGLAWWDRTNAPDDRDLKKLNAVAIGGGKGIWADPAPLAPWDFRGSHGGEQFTYHVKTAEEVAAPVEKKEEPKKEEVKKISAKGNEEYTGTYNIPPDAKLPEGVTPEALLVKHMPSIAKDAAGKPIGMAIPNISQIPFAPQLGFKDGDIISNVNGIPVQDPAQIMQMAPQFKDVKQFNVQVLRNGQPTTLTINIP
jgi:endonuclease YncB( thermonuclease family)